MGTIKKLLEEDSIKTSKLKDAYNNKPCGTNWTEIHFNCLCDVFDSLVQTGTKSMTLPIIILRKYILGNRPSDQMTSEGLLRFTNEILSSICQAVTNSEQSSFQK